VFAVVLSGAFEKSIGVDILDCPTDVASLSDGRIIVVDQTNHW
jgi:hypothetical protein